MKYLKQWKQNGNWRIRLRRRFKEVELEVLPGYRADKATLANSQAFLAAHLAAQAEPVSPLKPGEKRAAYGSVAWLVGEYFGSLDFLGARSRCSTCIEDTSRISVFAVANCRWPNRKDVCRDDRYADQGE